MLKFLRKYSKVLLVVFGAFLMVAFLAPQAIQQLGQLSDRKVATIDGEPVMLSDLQRASQELTILRQINPALTSLVPTGRDEDLHWLLLTREAKQGGYYGSDGDGQQFVPEIADLLANQFFQRRAQFGIQTPPEEQADIRQEALELVLNNVKQAASTIQSTDRAIKYEGNFRGGNAAEQKAYLILAKARGVFRMINAVSYAPRLSTPRLRAEASHQSNAAAADALVLNARLYTDAVEQPTDEQLQAHFDTYRDIPQDAPADVSPFGIGYRLEPGITFEYLTIDAQAIRDAITIDPIEARKRYEQNRDTYVGDFAGEREAVNDALREQTFQRILDEIDRLIKAETLRALAGIPQNGPYYDLPDDWAQRRPDYNTLAQKIVDRVKQQSDTTIPLPRYDRIASSIQTQRALALAQGIGQSFILLGNNRVGFPQVVFTAREFDANPDFRLQEGLTATAFVPQDARGNRYYFRILSTRQAQAPQEITDDIRNRIIADQRAIRAFEFLSEQLEVYRATLAVSDFDTLKATLPTPTGNPPEVIQDLRFQRERASSQLPIFQDPEVTRALTEQAYRLNPFTPIDEQDPDLRAIAAASPYNLSLVIANVTQLAPLTQDQFEARLAFIDRDVRALETSSTDSEPPFTLDALAKRHDLVRLDTKSEDQSPDQGLTPDQANPDSNS